MFMLCHSTSIFPMYGSLFLWTHRDHRNRAVLLEELSCQKRYKCKFCKHRWSFLSPDPWSFVRLRGLWTHYCKGERLWGKRLLSWLAFKNPSLQSVLIVLNFANSSSLLLLLSQFRSKEKREVGVLFLSLLKEIISKEYILSLGQRS